MSPGFFIWQTMSEVMGALPPSLAEKIMRGFGAGAYYLWREKRRIARENFSRVLHKPANHPQVGRVARASFSNYTLYILNMLRYDRVTKEDLRRRVHFHIAPESNQLLNQDCPIILVSVHFGNMDYAAPVAVERYRSLTMAAETIKPPELFEHLAAMRSQHRIYLIPFERASRKIIEALKTNQFVGFMLDVGIAGYAELTRVPVTFFGQETLFPSTPALLAQRYNAPLMVTFAHIGPGDEIHITADPPIFVSTELPREQALQEALQRVATAFEKAIMKHPEQWYIFRPMWPNPNELKSALASSAD